MRCETTCARHPVDEEDGDAQRRDEPQVGAGGAGGDSGRRGEAEEELARQAAREDPAERAGAREVGWHEDEEGGQRGERGQATFEGHAREARDEPRHQEDRDRRAHDAAELGEGRQGAGDQSTEGEHPQRPAEPGGDHAEAEQSRREVQRREGEDVAQGGDERGGHVVEVPAEADGPGREPEGGGEHRHRRDEPTADRHQDEIGEPDGQPESEADGDERDDAHEQDRHPQGERGGGEHVLAEQRGAPQPQLQLADVDGRGDAVAERPEHVAPQADGGRHQHQQPRAPLEGGREGAQHGPRHERGGGVQCERDEPLPGVSPGQQAAAGHGGRPLVAMVELGTAGTLPSGPSYEQGQERPVTRRRGPQAPS